MARSYVEGEGRAEHDVSSMILIAPVNQGSCGPDSAPLPDDFQPVRDQQQADQPGAGELSDGIGQAADDLLPGSAFLSRLNGGTRPPDVPYHILAGDVGVIPRECRQQAQAQLDVASRNSGLLSVFSRVANRELSSLLDELTDGSGDGCVAVDRTRLPGVPDHVTIRANHAELIRAPMFYPDDGPGPLLCRTCFTGSRPT